jgi:hypothetical protein
MIEHKDYEDDYARYRAEARALSDEVLEDRAKLWGTVYGKPKEVKDQGYRVFYYIFGGMVAWKESGAACVLATLPTRRSMGSQDRMVVT